MQCLYSIPLLTMNGCYGRLGIHLVKCVEMKDDMMMIMKMMLKKKELTVTYIINANKKLFL